MEGNNLIVERYTGKREKDVPATIAARVVRTAPDLIFMAGAVPLIREIMARSKTIPFVIIVPDPLILGRTKSLARPGGNVTGFSFDGGAEMDAKGSNCCVKWSPRSSVSAICSGAINGTIRLPTWCARGPGS